jgi:hypothetical protein
VVVDVAVALITLIFTLAVHEAPLVPHDLTWSTWAPSVVETLVAIEAPLKVVVELLSIE